MGFNVIDENGPPCHRCGRPLQVREHDQIGRQQLRARFYYVRWSYCTNKACDTSTVRLKKFRRYTHERLGGLFQQKLGTCRSNSQ